MQCFGGSFRGDSLEDEVVYLRSLLDRECKDRKEAHALLSQEQAKCALLEQEISNAVQAAQEMGESLRMYFSQTGSDASSDDRLRALCEATVPEQRSAVSEPADGSSLRLETPQFIDSSHRSAAGSLVQHLPDAYPSYDQSSVSMARPYNSSPFKGKPTSCAVFGYGRRKHQRPPQQHFNRLSGGSASTRMSMQASSSDFSPLLTSQPRLGAGSKRMQQHVLEVADQLQGLAMSWKQRLDEYQPLRPASASSAAPAAIHAAAGSNRTSAAYHPAVAEARAAAAVASARGCRLKQTSAADQRLSAAPHPKIPASASLGVTDSFTFSECSSAAAPLQLSVKAATTPAAAPADAPRAAPLEDSFPTPPMSVSLAHPLAHTKSPSYSSGTSGYMEASGTSGANEGWTSSRSCGNSHCTDAQGGDNNLAETVVRTVSDSCSTGIGRFKGGSHCRQMPAAVAVVSEVEKDLLQQEAAWEAEDDAMAGSPSSAGSLITVSEEQSDLSEPEQFPNATYQCARDQQQQQQRLINLPQANTHPPTLSWARRNGASPTVVSGCAITRGAALLKASPVSSIRPAATVAIGSPAQLMLQAAAGPVARAGIGRGSPSVMVAAAAAPKYVDQQYRSAGLQEQQYEADAACRQQHSWRQQHSVVEALPSDMKRMSPLTRNQAYLGSSHLSYAST